MEKVDVLLGLQWGDEGKGKIVDVLTPNYDIVARFQGGPNAGHTIEFDHKHVVLRSIPSGVFNPDSINIIGNGVVFDPVLFKAEIEELSKYIPINDLKEKILISSGCHVITPFHKLQDKINELKKGANKVGTTGKGIGPTYTDKASRIGVRFGEIIDALNNLDYNVYFKFENILSNLIESSQNYKEALPENFQKYFNKELVYKDLLDIELEEFKEACVWIKQNFGVINTTNYINKAIVNNTTILAEGAQGTMLDIDHGTYPFVTSSNTTSGGVCTGLGIAPNKVGEVYGIFKAYCTRVGAGPFPTEDFGRDGDKIREVGHEFGAVTGRERRCGWLDLVELKYACTINGVTQLIMMKSDVLSDFNFIKVCIAYENKKTGEIHSVMPDDLTDMEPVYRKFVGWKGKDLSKITRYDDLPSEFKNYIEYIEEQTNTKITIISVGPDRTQTIFR